MTIKKVLLFMLLVPTFQQQAIYIEPVYDRSMAEVDVIAENDPNLYSAERREMDEELSLEASRDIGNEPKEPEHQRLTRGERRRQQRWASYQD